MALKDGAHPTGNSRPKASRPKPKVVKRLKSAKHSPPKPEQRPKQKKPVTLSERRPSVKVPACEFPSEVCDGINYDPSLEDDYRTVFTLLGCYISTLHLKTSETADEEKNNDKDSNNVDYCQLCKRNVGELICCNKCPRAFHDTCLKVSNSTLNQPWECPRSCKEDCSEQPEDIVRGSNYDTIAHAY